MEAIVYLPSHFEVLENRRIDDVIGFVHILFHTSRFHVVISAVLSISFEVDVPTEKVGGSVPRARAS